ncbi:MAG TPA: 2-C-methyl-D-erythritol 2,4-cyclodiphosphate synthase [Candidatus Omnitrophota bacterium]|nr:2-C-methyl-D-erythritol 2,4-cyclodiphosphate synthase [Candidatus Omnitrophota bacterium]
MHFKTGLGYDIHRLVKGRKLFLGGVEIPHVKGLEGHSDADVVLHAICDALLGAVGKGDIGEHFPNTDPKYKGIPSLVLLEKVHSIVQGEGFTIGNIDTMILAEEPNLKAYKPKMQGTIAKTLGIDLTSVNIKATTQEGIGFGSTHEAIAAYATVLLVKR